MKIFLIFWSILTFANDDCKEYIAVRNKYVTAGARTKFLSQTYGQEKLRTMTSQQKEYISQVTRGAISALRFFREKYNEVQRKYPNCQSCNPFVNASDISDFRNLVKVSAEVKDKTFFEHFWDAYVQNGDTDAKLFFVGFGKALKDMGLELKNMTADTINGTVLTIFDPETLQYYEVKSGLMNSLIDNGYAKTIKNIPVGMAEAIVGNAMSGDPEKIGEAYANFLTLVPAAETGGAALTKLGAGAKLSLSVPSLANQGGVLALAVSQVTVDGTRALALAGGSGGSFAAGSLMQENHAPSGGSSSNSPKTSSVKPILDKSLEKIKSEIPKNESFDSNLKTLLEQERTQNGNFRDTMSDSLEKLKNNPEEIRRLRANVEQRTNFLEEEIQNGNTSEMSKWENEIKKVEYLKELERRLNPSSPEPVKVSSRILNDELMPENGKFRDTNSSSMSDLKKDYLQKMKANTKSGSFDGRGTDLSHLRNTIAQRERFALEELTEATQKGDVSEITKYQQILKNEGLKIEYLNQLERELQQGKAPKPKVSSGSLGDWQTTVRQSLASTDASEIATRVQNINQKTEKISREMTFNQARKGVQDYFDGLKANGEIKVPGTGFDDPVPLSVDELFAKHKKYLETADLAKNPNGPMNACLAELKMGENSYKYFLDGELKKIQSGAPYDSTKLTYYYDRWKYFHENNVYLEKLLQYLKSQIKR